ncbi:MAG: hypothetical protein FJ276_09455 [Planctomycetes bacterium]|nr:hypothetical protein [Planctomycetota bacterium]
MSSPNPEPASPVHLRLNMGLLLFRIVFNALLGLLVLILGVSYASESDWASTKLGAGLGVLLLELYFGFRIAAHLRILRKAIACRTPTIAWDSNTLLLPQGWFPKQSISLRQIGRCIVRERERLLGRSHWDFVIEEQSRAGLISYAIQDNWFPGGQPEMRALARVLDEHRQLAGDAVGDAANPTASRLPHATEDTVDAFLQRTQAAWMDGQLGGLGLSELKPQLARSSSADQFRDAFATLRPMLEASERQCIFGAEEFLVEGCQWFLITNERLDVYSKGKPDGPCQHFALADVDGYRATGWWSKMTIYLSLRSGETVKIPGLLAVPRDEILGAVIERTRRQPEMAGP